MRQQCMAVSEMWEIFNQLAVAAGAAMIMGLLCPTPIGRCSIIQGGIRAVAPMATMAGSRFGECDFESFSCRNRVRRIAIESSGKDLSFCHSNEGLTEVENR